MSRIVLIPPHLRHLQRPWFPAHAYPKAENIIRFGGTVYGLGNGQAQTLEWLTAGAGTVISQPAGQKTLISFQELSEGQYCRVTDKEESRRILASLRQFLAANGVEITGYYNRQGPALLNHAVLSDIMRSFSILPASHLGHNHFTQFQLGGWGGGAAKCSAYSDPVVKIFDFATQGPLRNLYAIHLHEIGHSFAATLPPHYIDILDQARQKIIRLGASYDVDYLYGPKEREGRCLSSVSEFIAETYLMYVTQGAYTPEGLARIAEAWKGAKPEDLSRHHNFLQSISPEARRLWTAVWNLYRKCFDYTEYA
jgi:hypothetical protein